MKLAEFLDLKRKVIAADYEEEINWQQTVPHCSEINEFAWQAVWVIISSGMKNQIARIIEDRVIRAWDTGQPISKVFKHKGKVRAINTILWNRDRLFYKYCQAADKLQYLETLPYIGKITKYHLAKNLGEDVVKPDRHLVRIAKHYGTSPDDLCAKLAAESGLKKATVDMILWRSANLGIWKVPSHD